MVRPVGYYREAKLTGNKRVRKGWFGKIILQVEVELEYMSPIGREYDRNHRPGYVEPVSPPKTRWRDATAHDVGLETTIIKGVAV